MVALVNRYDNLCNPPQIARALTPHGGRCRCSSRSRRSKFDATVLNAFIRMMGVYPAGSVVQLTDDRYAMVTSVNSSRPLKPHVLVHDPKRRARGRAVPEPGDLGIRRSLAPNKLQHEQIEALSRAPRAWRTSSKLRPWRRGRRGTRIVLRRARAAAVDAC